MAKTEPFVTDEQWAKFEPLLPEYPPSPKGGRKRKGNREVFEGIAWVLRSGACWKDLPEQHASPSTCCRRLQGWEEQGIWLTTYTGSGSDTKPLHRPESMLAQRPKRSHDYD